MVFAATCKNKPDRVWGARERNSTRFMNVSSCILRSIWGEPRHIAPNGFLVACSRLLASLLVAVRACSLPWLTMKFGQHRISAKIILWWFLRSVSLIDCKCWVNGRFLFHMSRVEMSFDLHAIGTGDVPCVTIKRWPRVIFSMTYSYRQCRISKCIYWVNRAYSYIYSELSHFANMKVSERYVTMRARVHVITILL
jgi:hypothetical protein